MLETINNLGKQRAASIDLQNIYAHVVVASANTTNNGYNQVVLEKLVLLDSVDKVKESLAKEKVSLVSYGSNTRL